MKQKEHKKIISTVSVDFHEKQGWEGGLEQQTLWSGVCSSNHPSKKFACKGEDGWGIGATSPVVTGSPFQPPRYEKKAKRKIRTLRAAPVG